MEGLTKLKPECFTDINQAHLDMMMSDGTTVMEFVANKVPCTIDVFTQMLDKSITIDERECGLVGKTLLLLIELFHFLDSGPTRLQQGVQEHLEHSDGSGGYGLLLWADQVPFQNLP